MIPETVPCPLCGSDVPRENGPLVIGADGLPEAVALRAGLGVPVASSGRVRVFCDGVPVTECIGYDRLRVIAWRNQTGPDGRVIVLNDKLQIEKVTGAITVERLEVGR